MKRALYILLAVALLAVFLPDTAYAATLTHARLIIDNQEITGLDTPPIILNNRVMVPARAVFEHVGGRVEWNATDRVVTVFYGTDVLVMTVGSTWAQLNGEFIHMDEPPVIMGGRTLIPLRFPAEAFGFEVDWDAAQRAAILLSPDNGDSQDNQPNDTPPDNNIADPTPHPDHMADPTPTPAPAGSISTDISTSPIVYVSHPRANITNLISPTGTGALAYTIIASSPITYVNHFLLYDNRLVVDIYNALSSLSAPFAAVGPVSEVRSSQFSRAPYVTRVVFDLVGAVEFSLDLSYDRQTLTIAFAPNIIDRVITTSTYYSDTLLIQGHRQPSIRLCTLGFPVFFTVFIDNAEMAAHGSDVWGGIFASRFATGQRTAGAAYVRMYIRDEWNWPAISVTHGVDSMAVVMHHGLNGVRYDFATRELRICRSVATLGIGQMLQLDEYLQNRHTVILPAGAGGLGLGTLYVADGRINSISLRQDINGNTLVVFDTARVMAFTLHETPAEYVIRARLPQEVYQFIVVIDPGHGGRQPGASHHGIVEKDLVLTISHMVMEYLNANPNIRAYMTRHDDVTVANSQRARFANQMADLYVSIHANAVNNRPAVCGIETWFADHPREADFAFTSRDFATIMQRNLIEATGAADRGIRVGNNFIVVRDTLMPAVLVEVGFLTNAAEAARLATYAHQRLLARAIYDGIVEAFEVYRPSR